MNTIDLISVFTTYPSDNSKILFERNSLSSSFTEHPTQTKIWLFNSFNCGLFYRVTLLKPKYYCVKPLNYGYIEPNKKQTIDGINFVFYDFNTRHGFIGVHGSNI